MSTERYDVLVIGFVVEAEDVLKPFEVTVPEKSHMEDRFHPKTGAKLPPVKVIDAEERVEYEVDKKRFKDSEEVFDHLCKKTGAMWQTIIDDGDAHIISFEPTSVRVKGNGNLKLEAKKLACICEDASQIRTLFKKNWGIDLGEAAIQTVETYG
jgi:hypothetical protein